MNISNGWNEHFTWLIDYNGFDCCLFWHMPVSLGYTTPLSVCTLWWICSCKSAPWHFVNPPCINFHSIGTSQPNCDWLFDWLNCISRLHWKIHNSSAENHQFSLLEIWFSWYCHGFTGFHCILIWRCPMLNI